MAKRSKKAKLEKVDGLGPEDLKKIHRAVRQVWSWSYPRRLAAARAIDSEGFPRCELCNKRVPKITVDHIVPVGEIGGPNYIQKMWCPSKELQSICRKCHAPKTRADNAKARAAKKAVKKRQSVKDDIDDFF